MIARQGRVETDSGSDFPRSPHNGSAARVSQRREPGGTREPTPTPYREACDPYRDRSRDACVGDADPRSPAGGALQGRVRRRTVRRGVVAHRRTRGGIGPIVSPGARGCWSGVAMPVRRSNVAATDDRRPAHCRWSPARWAGCGLQPGNVHDPVGPPGDGWVSLASRGARRRAGSLSSLPTP